METIHSINKWVAEFKDAILSFSGTYVAFCHSDWNGVKNSTLELFESVIFIREINDQDMLDQVAEAIIYSSVEQFILSGYPKGWGQVIRLVKYKKPSIRFKILWHGSIAQLCEDYLSKDFLEILELTQQNFIHTIGFVKKSTYELYCKIGYRCKFVRNRVLISNYVYREKLLDFNNIKIGVFSSNITIFRKNIHTNIAAVCYISNAHLTLCPASQHLRNIIAHFKLHKYSYIENTVARDEMYKLIKEQDIIFYVTFSECAPMLPLEAMELGVLCLMGSNNHYYENYPILQKFLVVAEVDNPRLIADMALKALSNKDLIMSEYRKFSIENNMLSIEGVKDFLT